jgi:hypothetical protein
LKATTRLDSSHHIVGSLLRNSKDKESKEQRGQGSSGRPGSQEECLSAHTSWYSNDEPRKGERLCSESKRREAKGPEEAKGPKEAKGKEVV